MSGGDLNPASGQDVHDLPETQFGFDVPPTVKAYHAGTPVQAVLAVLVFHGLLGVVVWQLLLHGKGVAAAFYAITGVCS